MWFNNSKKLIAQCITTKDINLGKTLHSYFIKSSLILSTFISNRLIELYSKCDALESAQKVFDDLPEKNVRSWNNIVSGYARNGLFYHARKLFDEMPERDIVGFNSILSGLTHHGLYEECLCLFKSMQSLCGGLFLDEYTVVSVVGSCGDLGAVRLLHQLHSVIVLVGLWFNPVVCNAMIVGYGKCGKPDLAYVVFSQMVERDVVSWTSMVAAFAKACKMEEACRVFDQMPVRNTVSWTALIAGFAQNGQGTEALELFDQMQRNGVPPSESTYVVVLGACADLALLDKGKQLHGHILRSSIKSPLLNLYVCNVLIDMYCKCGDMRTARALFERMPKKDTISWNTLINGYAQNGNDRESLELFERMIEEKVKPNHVTFLGVLSTCCHTGLLEESVRVFKSMAKHGLKPEAEHYAIVIDLLGRKNRLNEALELIENAPGGYDHIGMWGALLAACQVHGNVDLAKRAADMLLKLEPSNSGRYVMLSNAYASGNRWNDSGQVRRLVGEKGLRKKAGFSWVEDMNS